MAEEADTMSEDVGEVADGAEAAGELVFPGLASVGLGQGQAEPDSSEETGAVNERDIADLAPSSASEETAAVNERDIADLAPSSAPVPGLVQLQPYEYRSGINECTESKKL